MTWLLWTLAFLLVLPIILLIPRVRFSGSAYPGHLELSLSGVGFRISYDFRNGFDGWILFFRLKKFASQVVDSVSSFSTTKKAEKAKSDSQPPTSDKSSPADREPKSTRNPIPRDLAILLLKRLLQLVKRLLGSIQTDYLRVNLTVATPDPMWTGIVFGLVQPVMIWNEPPKREFNLLISFERETPVIEAEWSFSSRPIVVIWILLTWGMKLPWRHILRERRKKKEGKSRG